MEILGTIFLLIGCIISIVYGIILLVKAFQTSVLWGLAYLFIPFAALVFIFVHWDKAGKPFLMSLISIPFFILGFMCMPGINT